MMCSASMSACLVVMSSYSRILVSDSRTCFAAERVDGLPSWYRSIRCLGIRSSMGGLLQIVSAGVGVSVVCGM